MGTKQNKVETKEEVATPVEPGREPAIVKEPKSTFDQRTAVGQPFVLENGTQDNGASDLSEVEGAEGKSVREGNTPVADEEN